MKTLMIIFLFLNITLIVPLSSLAQYVEKEEREVETNEKKPKKEKKEKPKKEDKEKNDKWQLGGGFTILPNNPFALEISPTLSYQFRPNFTLGAEVAYLYNRSDRDSLGVEQNHIFTGSLMSRYQIGSFLSLDGEIEGMSTTFREEEGQQSRAWLWNPLLGASLILPLSKRFAFQAQVLYNLNYDSEKSPYPTPWRFRFGISF